MTSFSTNGGEAFKHSERHICATLGEFTLLEYPFEPFKQRGTSFYLLFFTVVRAVLELALYTDTVYYTHCNYKGILNTGLSPAD